MSESFRKDRDGILIFLAFVAVMVGCSEKKKSQIETAESSLANFDAYRKSLTGLRQDLELINDEKEKLKSVLQSRDPIQIIQPATVIRS